MRYQITRLPATTDAVWDELTASVGLDTTRYRTYFFITLASPADIEEWRAYAASLPVAFWREGQQWCTDHMRTVRKAGGWWVLGMPAGAPAMGPYKTKQEAEGDLRGVARACQAAAKGDDRFFTSGL